MFVDMKVKEFVDLVASEEPVPGGGSVSALVGGVSMALLEMVTNLSIGRKKYAQHEDDLVKLKDEFLGLRSELLELMQKDAASYEVVVEAFSLPRESDEDKAARSAAIQEGLYGAALVPLEIAQTCMRGLLKVEEVLEKGNTNAYSDAKVAGVILRSALYGACYNVQINVESLKDKDRANELDQAIIKLRQEADQIEKRIIDMEVS